MAALRPVSSRCGLREEPDGSADSTGTSRTPVLTVSSVSSEPTGSPGQVTEPPGGKNLWEQICEEYEAELPPFPEGYKVKAAAPALPTEEAVVHGFHAEHYLPAPPAAVTSHIPCPPYKLGVIDPKTCSPKEYLETFIFPVLLPGMASLLHQAKKEKCFERKRTRFIACDFLTEWLYNHHPKRSGEPFTEFFSIPFVEEWLKQHPRPPILLSLLLTEEQAAIAIQSFWRAYLVRCDPEIQELRQWQKKLREEKHVRQRVRTFWANQEQKVRCKMEEEEEEEAEPAAMKPQP
ncbi:IQ domain-containing protein K [Ochotona princeps]|uniref:IQ domain-containing protein K n=1 Tax=Ochotona princeps TaxID=9978 RepID=UPI0027150F0D|nr:IQ domain-containing protein K [Ochotona princeps]